jgi:hypothetical protein
MSDKNMIIYIQQCIQQGYDFNSIRASLIASGYSSSEINQAYNSLVNQNSQKSNTGRSQTIYLLITLIIITFLVVLITVLIHKIFPPPTTIIYDYASMFL